jgi:hypothetical protein
LARVLSGLFGQQVALEEAKRVNTEWKSFNEFNQQRERARDDPVARYEQQFPKASRSRFRSSTFAIMLWVTILGALLAVAWWIYR